MLVALGFVLCALVVLLFGRTIWNIAVRLGASRNAKEIPVAMLELQADRDRLRVEHAMMARKLELRVQDIKMRMTEQMAEVSRSRNRVQTLVQDIAAKNEIIATRDQEITGLTAEITTYKADLVSCTESIKHLTAANNTLQEDNRKLTSKLAEVQSALKLAESAESKWAQQLATGTSPNPVSTTSFKETTTEDRIKQRIDELTNLSVEMTGKTEPQTTPTPALELAPVHATLNQKLADAEREANAMTEELRSLDKVLQTAPESAPAPVSEKPVVVDENLGDVANVISLAQRIKALQFGSKE